jgi:predicted 3-demethylubiquinone-9 3-methyltransferase (glyoxalase superfamily)
MFDGNAKEAMEFYTSLFSNSEIKYMRLYKAGEAGKEGSVMSALFSLNGNDYMCIDSIASHDFMFTPAISLFVHCSSEDEIDTLFKALSQGGKTLMELGSYGFSKKFGWLEDRYNVSWQLNLE